MRKYLYLGLVCLAVAAFASCSRDELPTAPGGVTAESTDYEVDTELLALVMMKSTGWPALDEDGLPVDLPKEPTASGDKCLVFQMDRQMITDDIAHYSFRLRTGPGVNDEIGLHRVVRERRPYRPIRTRSSVFLQHGSGKDFTTNFLPGVVGAHVPDDFGIATYLAQGDVDVWGIDQASTLLAWEGEGLPFLAECGLQRHADDLATGVQVARIVRLFSGNGYRKMALSGFSTGLCIGYAMLNADAALPPGRQKISGYIPIDYAYKTDDPEWEQESCDAAASIQASMDAGVFGGYSYMLLFGLPAESDPDGPSAIIPGLTNLQAALLVFSTPTGPPYPGHFFAGEYDLNGLPTGLQFLDNDEFTDFMVNSPPYQTVNALERDIALVNCPDEDPPWDDNLAEITVPIFFVYAAGGYGPPGDYALDLVASTDITELIVSLRPPEEAALDYGHVDLFAANNAPQLVWQPILDWILSHGPGCPSKPAVEIVSGSSPWSE